jgi:pimeloyl-ACP methyl ester carboxylesterase
MHAATMDATLLIDPRHNGPRTSGNGGWVAGALAQRLAAQHGTAVASVALRAPVPLGRPLPLRWQPDGSLALLDGEGGPVVADAAPATVDDLPAAVPAAPPADVAEAAGVAARLRHQQRGLGDAYAHCFVCGFARPDGLGVIVGPVPDAHGDDSSGLMATTWVPPAALAGAGGQLSTEAVWAALDCPAGMAWSHRLGRSQPIMTVRMAAAIDQPLRAGTHYTVLAWPLHRDGRKLHAGTAIVDAQGAVCALSQQLWLLPREVA